LLRKVYKNVNVSADPYVFEPETVQTTEEAEEGLKARQRRLEEHIMQSELKIKKQEEEIIGSAKTQAFYIVDEAEKQGEMIKQRSTQEGILDGLKLAAAEYCEQYISLERDKEELKKRCDKRIADIENQIIDTAFMLAQKIIGVELERNDEVLQNVIKQAIEKVKDDKELAVELSQANADRINKDEIQNNFKIKANENFGIDDILIHSEHGTIDVSIQKQFENLKNDLMDKLK
jgi:flagellar assembly protein FliH